jgi:glycosyltransferase involved in cell wall biosynthesis/polysaccharide pyruvyl transferase WcaK-like protein
VSLSPLVSVVTPSYNQARFIAATIESVLSQDYPNVEYIIMDGGSTDGTAEVVAPYRDRLAFISERDRGQSHAINKGFALARGEIVSYLNSDDIFLPGAIRHAVDALEADRTLAMVYGDGYQIAVDGAVISHFAPTQEFDLWRLAHLSDYVLQQTVFLRKWACDEVGPFDESLHYGLDWDMFIRIGMRFPVKYIPEHMGAIREYATAKSFAGGAKRVGELAAIVRRHTGRRFPPALFVYGLTTYERIWNARLERLVPDPLGRLRRKLQTLVTRVTHRIIGYVVRDYQGWYADGWASRRTHLMLPPPRGRFIELDVTLPPGVPFERQTIFLVADDGNTFATETFDKGSFTLALAVPPDYADKPLRFQIRAKQVTVPPAEELRLRRRVGYLLHRVRYGSLPEADRRQPSKTDAARCGAVVQRASRTKPSPCRSRKLRLLIGYKHFGAGNFGDDLTLEGLLGAGNATPANGVEFVACTPYDIESQRRRFPAIDWLPDSEEARERALRSADVWLAAGATAFQLESGPWMLDDLDRKRERCLELGVPMVFLGTGCSSPQAVDDERARRVIAAAERIWARDAYSAELLEGVARPGVVSMGADLANLALATTTAPPVEEGLLGVLLGLEDPETVDLRALEAALAGATPRRARWLVQEARSFPCTERWNYAALSERTRAALDLMPLDYARDDMAAFARAFGAPETVVTSRYHGALIAAWHACRVAVVARTGKLTAIAADLALPARARVGHETDFRALVAEATAVDPARLATLAGRARAMRADFFRWLDVFR